MVSLSVVMKPRSFGTDAFETLSGSTATLLTAEE
jgi:hypothetical protein